MIKEHPMPKQDKTETTTDKPAQDTGGWYGKNIPATSPDGKKKY